MLTSGYRLPFSVDNLYSGLARVEGLLSASKNDLTIEFQTQDNVLRVFKGRTGSLTLSYGDLYRVELKANWFRRKLIIRPNSLQSLGNMPGIEEGAISLSIKRKNLHEAKELASYVAMRISEIRLEQMDEEG